MAAINSQQDPSSMKTHRYPEEEGAPDIQGFARLRAGVQEIFTTGSFKKVNRKV